jgi:D-3-phosphoglycerate dehydrogenase
MSRRLLEADRSMREGRWAKYELYGTLLSGKVLGIVGAGNTGSRVGEVGAMWGMEAIGCVEHPSPERAEALAKKGIRLTDFDEVISTADYVSVHVPYKEATHYLFNADVFSSMKPGSFLLNLGRGGVVDEHALYDVLTAGDTLSGAALDVHEVEHEGERSPLADLPNVILTPHIGATVIDTQREIGRRIYEIVDAFGAKGDS